MIDAYPLQWPTGYQRTRFPDRSRFKASSLGKVRDHLIAEIGRLGGIRIVISTNIPVKNDGMPYAKYAGLKDCGVAVYFQRDGRPYVLACDKWNQIENNLHSLGLTIEAMRGLERWGVSDMLERTFQGFAALPPPQPGQVSKAWWDVLECRPDASRDVFEKQYRSRAISAHPDSGGSNERMAELNKAVDEAREARGV